MTKIQQTVMILFSYRLIILLYPFIGKMATAQGNCTITEMFEVIDSKFSQIPAGSRVFTGPPPKKAQEFCAQTMDYDSMNIYGLFSVLQHSIFPSCESNPDAATCKAIVATFETFKELKDKGCSPIFRNYLPAWTDWYQNKTTCEAGSFDYRTKKWTDENGCNLYSLCDIMVTILTLSANQQQTGTCGTTAILTVLSKEGPVRALRLATETVWMGRTSYLQDEPCSYIYDQFPGVEPLPNPNSTIEEICGNTPTNDCLEYERKLKNFGTFSDVPIFPQFPGIEFMMTQSFDTANRRHQTGSCEPEVFQLIKPDFSNAAEVSHYQATTLIDFFYYCEGMIKDLDYKCDQIDGGLFLDDYSQTIGGPSNTNYFLNNVLNPKWTDEQKNQMNEFLVNNDEKLVTDKDVQKFFSDAFCAVDPNGVMTSQDIIDKITSINLIFEQRFTSKINLSQLNKACEFAEENQVGVIMLMNSKPLDYVDQNVFLRLVHRCENGDEPYCNGQSDGEYPRFDHVVVLESCDISKNKYFIWTWAKTLELPSEVLVADDVYGIGGTIQNLFVIAPSDRKAQEVFDYDNLGIRPTPCKEDVCHVFCSNCEPSDDNSAYDSKRRFYVVFLMIICSSIWIL